MMLLARATNMGAQNAQELFGCWAASRPLGSRGDATGVPSEARFQTLRLSDSARVHLPLLERGERTMWEARSGWSQRSDSLSLRVSTGLAGWQLHLRRIDQRTWRGTATYLTDAIARGRPPLRVPLELTRVACDPAWLLPVSPAPQRRLTMPLYFDFQVERPVRLRSPLPVGIRKLVPLSGKERDTTLVNATVVQFVVDSAGRPDMGTLKVLRSAPPSSAVLEQALSTATRAMEFRPALLGNRPVAQLTQWRIEWR
ncbi:hypothetical protein [Gemmatimonas phototrophica]|uniref:TonB C-terminal domain-containing protein n=1 Tax=Gemmatimonas phototrophica TaxID=1379270 RepID=A0A143BHH7_9BACT|nr:hypothetical protein [Gemmatimonas phototrophica]AMW04488.1 hypothetical protein GEMMAAP_05790 [Gemmatimonas phototrophica]